MYFDIAKDAYMPNERGTITFKEMLRPMLNTPVLPVTLFTSAYFNRDKWFW